jgi:hypothetical protein
MKSICLLFVLLCFASTTWAQEEKVIINDTELTTSQIKDLEKYYGAKPLPGSYTNITLK